MRLEVCCLSRTCVFERIWIREWILRILVKTRLLTLRNAELWSYVSVVVLYLCENDTTFHFYSSYPWILFLFFRQITLHQTKHNQQLTLLILVERRARLPTKSWDIKVETDRVSKQKLAGSKQKSQRSKIKNRNRNFCSLRW